VNFFSKIIGGFIFFCLIYSSFQAQASNLNINDSTTTEADLYGQVYTGQQPQNMYLSIYESTQKDIDKKVLETMSQQINGLSQSDLNDALNGIYSHAFIRKCEEFSQNTFSSNLYQCLGNLKENYEYEKKLATLATTLKGDAFASEIWSDGDLSNSFFDLIVDFNIIETILFGENTYEYPFNDNYEFDNFAKNNSEEEAFENKNNDIENKTNAEINKKKDDDKKDSNENYCQDPDAIIFEKPVWNGNSDPINSTIIDNNNVTVANAALGGAYQFPEINNNCEGTSLFQGLLCAESWPCNNFFCIKISTTAQKIGGDSEKAKFVQKLVDIGIGHLNHLKGHTLTIQKNSNERFIISVGKFFDRPISLDVITQAVPVKLVQEKTAFDQEESVLDKLNTELCKRLGMWCEKNANNNVKTAEWTLSSQIEKGTLQQETWQKIAQNTEEWQQKYQEIKATWQEAQKIKHKQNFWEEFRKNLNIMALYFDSIKGAFFQLETSGLDILNETGQSCS